MPSVPRGPHARPLVLAAVVVVLTAAVVAGAERQVADEGGGHVKVGQRVPYHHDPPTSGPHWPELARWGIHEERLPPELWVHNLEHGGVVVLYRCDGSCPALLSRLRVLYDNLPKSKYGSVKLVATPYPTLETPLAALAWTWLDELAAFDAVRLRRFYLEHVDRGPEDAP